MRTLIATLGLALLMSASSSALAGDPPAPPAQDPPAQDAPAEEAPPTQDDSEAAVEAAGDAAQAQLEAAQAACEALPTAERAPCLQALDAPAAPPAVKGGKAQRANNNRMEAEFTEE